MGIIIDSRVRRRRANESELRGWARREFKSHVIAPAEVRSFRFRRADGSSDHWFGLTWTPGHLTLVGDLGEMTLTHYHALADFERGMHWAAGASYDYLMGKSDKFHDKELVKDETVREILRMAADEAAWVRAGQLREARRYRRQVQRATADWEADMAAWQRGRPDNDEDDRPRLTDCYPEREPVDRFEPRVPDPGAASSHFSRADRTLARWSIPEGWSLYARLWCALDHLFDMPDPNELMRPSGRRVILEALAEYVEDMSDTDIGEMCREIGLDEYYGTYRHKPRTLWQIEAIQHGCGMILDQIDPRRTWGRAWGDPVV